MGTRRQRPGDISMSWADVCSFDVNTLIGCGIAQVSAGCKTTKRAACEDTRIHAATHARAQTHAQWRQEPGDNMASARRPALSLPLESTFRQTNTRRKKRRLSTVSRPRMFAAHVAAFYMQLRCHLLRI